MIIVREVMLKKAMAIFRTKLGSLPKMKFQND